MPEFDPNWSKYERYPRFLWRAVEWETRLLRLSSQADLAHMHTATMRRYAGWIRIPYFLHCHGTDIRTRQYEPKTKNLVRKSLLQAEKVFYSTPDLREHANRLRPDAELCPITVNVDQIPVVSVDNHRSDRDDRPLIIFPSRWEPVKGGEAQIEVIRFLKERFGDRIRMQGLDWGENRHRAAKLGVDLIPKMSHSDYLKWLAQADVAIAQISGVMGVSELEAMAMGIPLVASLNPDWYNDSHPSLVNVPVFGGKNLSPTNITVETWGNTVAEVLENRPSKEEVNQIRNWLRKYHGPQTGVDFLSQHYSDWETKK